jgi:hypothetical protein
MGVGGEKAVKDQPYTPPVMPSPPVPPMPPTPAMQPVSGPSSLEILQALERGEIDVEEAQRRLGGA